MILKEIFGEKSEKVYGTIHLQIRKKTAWTAKIISITCAFSVEAWKIETLNQIHMSTPSDPKVIYI